MLENIQSGEEYGKLLIDTLKETPNDETPAQLLNYWYKNIFELAVQSYNEYIVGDKDTFLLGMEEIEKCYEDAGLQYTQDLLNGMIDKGVIEALINEAGEIVYGLTDKGRKYKL